MKKIIIPLLCLSVFLNVNAQEYKPGDHELLIMPTAYTMDSGDFYFSDWELFFLNAAYAPTPSTHVGLFMLFPITSDFVKTITLGVKQKYLDFDGFKAAAWATYTPDAKDGLTVGNVFSIGKNTHGLHLGIAGASAFDDEDTGWELVFLVGYRYDVSQKVGLIAEYTNAKSGIDEGFDGVISIGVRFIGESMSWDLAGVRPLESTGDFLFFPLLKATFLF